MSQTNNTTTKSKNKKRGKGIPVYANTKFGRKVIGHVSGEVYQKSLRSSGILRNPPAIALSGDELRQAEAAGAKFLRVQATDTGETFAIDLAMFRYYGFPVDRGYGRQVAASLDRFGRTSRIAERNPILDNPKVGEGIEYQRPQPMQLEFFPRRYDTLGNYSER